MSSFAFFKKTYTYSISMCQLIWFYSMSSSLGRVLFSLLSQVNFSCLKCYDCVLFSRIIISYHLVDIFEFLVVLLVPRSTDFPVSQSSQLIMSTKKNSSDYLFYFLCPLFSDATLLAALSQKRSTIF